MERQYSILVIDDEPVMQDSCQQILSRRGCDVIAAGEGYSGLDSLKHQPFDVLILDIHLPDISGEEVLKSIRVLFPNLPVIVITAYPTVESAVRAMKLGAFDYIPKPFTPTILRSVVAKALEYHAAQKGANDGNEDGLEAIIGESDVMIALKQVIKKAGMSDCTVLLDGETGTGKELAARALHLCSRRRHNNFISIDSGALMDTLVESELFGHVKGAFTGAFTDRVGKFEMAHNGTLFFDEISNMSLHVQGKLLRILQEQEFSRLGGNKTISVNVRILAATNQDITEEIKKGGFRNDLYFRLNVISLHMPPLRERRSDIPILAEHFLRRYRRRCNADRPKTISDRMAKKLNDYHWPGNIRELENVIERAAVFCDGPVLDVPDIVDSFTDIPSSPPVSDACSETQLEKMEKKHIQRILESCQYNQTRTARALGIDRKTLRYKIEKFRLR
jgi:DNA-binding NtrC family response regulator